ncbi:MAG TPA: complex I subunit 1 family protein [bacterium]|nr:complex I subunit 1 family protein [bacterium]
MSAAWAVAVFTAVVSLAGLMTWGERKLASMIQDRIGPNRANIRLTYHPWPFGPKRSVNLTAIGLFHIMADPVKLFFKEDFIPAGANKILHTLAPMISLGVPFVVFSVLPFAGPLHIQWRDFTADELYLAWLFSGQVLHLSDYTLKFVVADLDVGMIFVFAVSSLAVYGVILSGWSSNNKFSFLGALRGANQMISYEVSLGLCAVGLFMIYGGLSLSSLNNGQGELLLGVIPKWGIITQPLAFILFLTCGMAEIKRIPFDLPEGESEIVAGYFLEYSSMKFTMFMFGEYVEMILLAGVITTLFFGGWQIPWVSPEGIHVLHWQLLWSDTFLSGLGATGIHILIALLQAGKFATCTVVWVYLIFMIRWTFPRFRYDQVMKLGWQMILPLALINIMVTGLILAFTRGWLNG